jgi:hypothetical protein
MACLAWSHRCAPKATGSSAMGGGGSRGQHVRGRRPAPAKPGKPIPSAIDLQCKLGELNEHIRPKKTAFCPFIGTGGDRAAQLGDSGLLNPLGVVDAAESQHRQRLKQLAGQGSNADRVRGSTRNRQPNRGRRNRRSLCAIWSFVDRMKYVCHTVGTARSPS